MRKSTLVLAALAAFASAPSHAASKVLSVQEIIQEHDEWCWSATSRAALLHFAVDQQQCAIAEYTRTHSDTPEVNLGTVALRAGKKVLFDGESMKITNAPDANKYLYREYRQGWEL